jgi:hypothetical protein
MVTIPPTNQLHGAKRSKLSCSKELNPVTLASISSPTEMTGGSSVCSGMLLVGGKQIW